MQLTSSGFAGLRATNSISFGLRRRTLLLGAGAAAAAGAAALSRLRQDTVQIQEVETRNLPSGFLALVAAGDSKADRRFRFYSGSEGGTTIALRPNDSFSTFVADAERQIQPRFHGVRQDGMQVRMEVPMRISLQKIKPETIRQFEDYCNTRYRTSTNFRPHLLIEELPRQLIEMVFRDKARAYMAMQPSTLFETRAGSRAFDLEKPESEEIDSAVEFWIKNSTLPLEGALRAKVAGQLRIRIEGEYEKARKIATELFLTGFDGPDGRVKGIKDELYDDYGIELTGLRHIILNPPY